MQPIICALKPHPSVDMHLLSPKDLHRERQGVSTNVLSKYTVQKSISHIINLLISSNKQSNNK